MGNLPSGLDGGASLCYIYSMTTTHPTADQIPGGFWIASNLDDRMLAFGEDLGALGRTTWGDFIAQDELAALIEDIRADLFPGCELCGFHGPDVVYVETPRGDGWICGGWNGGCNR